jgi:hypothetical protein
MRRADQITGVVMLIFAAALMEGGRRMPPSNTFGPGAGFLPFWLGIIMAILSILLFVSATRESRKDGDRSPFPDWRTGVAVVATLAGLAAYNLFIERLGFLVSTTLLSAFLVGVIERERWYTTAVVAVGNAVVLYVIFQVLLGISLPKSTLGF